MHLHYGDACVFYMSHMHLHYGELSRRHGAVVNRTCFSGNKNTEIKQYYYILGESIVGFLGELVSCKQIPLKQMTTRLMAWRAGALIAGEDEDVRDVISRLMKEESYTEKTESFCISTQNYKDEFWNEYIRYINDLKK